MTVDMTKGGATSAQIAEARDWIADAYPANPLAAGNTHPVYEDSADYVQRFVGREYPGGWSAFVAECCTFVQL